MWSAWYGFHDGIVGGVSDWGLCEDFDQRVKSREVYVPSSVVSMKERLLNKFEPNSQKDAEETRRKLDNLHYTVVCHYDGRWWSDVLDCAF